MINEYRKIRREGKRNSKRITLWIVGRTSPNELAVAISVMFNLNPKYTNALGIRCLNV